MIFKEIDRSLSEIVNNICINSNSLLIYCYIAESDGLRFERVNINLSECVSQTIEFSVLNQKLVSIDNKTACFLSDSAKESIIIYLSPETDACGDFVVKEHNSKKDFNYSYKNGLFQINIWESTEEIRFAQIIDLYYVKSNELIDADNLLEHYFM